MIALMQRVLSSSVLVEGQEIGRIEQGLMVLVGVQKSDQQTDVDRLLERILGYRVFADDLDKMNLSLVDIQGGLLLVPQFTLAADTRKGRRPSFASAAPPELGRELFDYLVEQAQRKHSTVATGQFGADMKVSLINDGPVTFWLETNK